MAREPIAGLMDSGVPSQMEEDDLRAEVEPVSYTHLTLPTNREV